MRQQTPGAGHELRVHLTRSVPERALVRWDPSRGNEVSHDPLLRRPFQDGQLVALAVAHDCDGHRQLYFALSRCGESLRSIETDNPTVEVGFADDDTATATMVNEPVS